jgi:hypothetical protein
MEKANLLRRKRRGLSKEQERISWTKSAVNAVDRLPFAKWKDATDKATIYLWQYLRDGLGLDNFDAEKFCLVLERARQMRNYIIHRSLELSILDERMSEIKNHLTGFPILLVEAASKIYPNACTENPPEEGEDGTPTYLLIEEFI